jgi:hypothetical protein
LMNRVVQQLGFDLIARRDHQRYAVVHCHAFSSHLVPSTAELSSDGTIPHSDGDSLDKARYHFSSSDSSLFLLPLGRHVHTFLAVLDESATIAIRPDRRAPYVN